MGKKRDEFAGSIFRNDENLHCASQAVVNLLQVMEFFDAATAVDAEKVEQDGFALPVGELRPFTAKEKQGKIRTMGARLEGLYYCFGRLFVVNGLCFCKQGERGKVQA